jgi:catalase
MEETSIEFVPFTGSVEQPTSDESQTFAEIGAVMGRLGAVMNDHYRHAVRSVHAKSHGLLKAELAVSPDLPKELAQGLFAQPASYPSIIRFSTTPGDLLADSVSTPRGMAIKAITSGAMPMIAGHESNATQDFVLVNARTFGLPDAKAFLKVQKVLEANLNDPEIFKKVVSNTARGLNAVLALVGLQSDAIAQLGHPETNLLGETYGSCAAFRYGDYIAKLIVEPASENLRALHNKHVNVNFHYSGLRDAVVDFFKTETAVWDVKVQLCADEEKMPIENPSKPWPETLVPYRKVATLTAKPQDAYSPKRRVFVDEILTFNPWHCLEAHQPLGQIMRARKPVYAQTSQYRHAMNDRPTIEPKRIEELPD